jgi:hypothetical protein
MSTHFFSHLKKTLTKADLILICFLIACTFFSFSLWFRDKSGQRVIIMVDGKTVKNMSLEDGKNEVVMQGLKGPFVFEIKDGKVKMKDSACPNKLCVKMGWIRHEGQVVCCIPNRVVLKIIGKKDGYDALAR